LEYNADTPTSLYEAGSFQWSWLEDLKARGELPPNADQFNGLYEAITARFEELFAPNTDIHFASGEGSEEDYATVEFMAYAARDAGMGAHHVLTEAIGLTNTGQLADGEDRVIGTLFKLHPWEDTFQADFAKHLATSRCRFLEPAWKALVSNKGILPVLWEMFEGHPNLLASFFTVDVEEDSPAYRRAVDSGHFAQGRVTKPLFSREGASITIESATREVLEASANRDYDMHPTVIQAYHPLPVFDGWRPVIGSWIIGETCAGMGIREDRALITQDMSRFKPHFLMG
jgi:glutathionylspermidine synthase